MYVEVAAETLSFASKGTDVFTFDVSLRLHFAASNEAVEQPSDNFDGSVFPSLRVTLPGGEVYSNGIIIFFFSR